MNNTEFKELLIQRLEETQSYFKPVSSRGEYRTRCPLCGDSDDEMKAHFYLHIDTEDNSDIVYNCFKCGRGGVLSNKVLEAFGFKDQTLLTACNTLQKTSTKIDKKGVNKEFIYKFSYELPEIKLSNKTYYIEKRLERKFSVEDFKRMKVIPSLKEFLYLNRINKVPFERWVIDNIDEYYIGFITEGNSHILFRDIRDNSNPDFKWLKYPINEKSKMNKVFYTMKCKIDIFTNDVIQINLSEGIFDILSACYNLNHDGENQLNIAVGGKEYRSILMYIIELGLIGNNVVVNIFADNDETFNKKARDPTNIEYFKNIFKNMKYLFKEVNVFYNTLSKDIGVAKEYISLKQYKL